jgi:hypothetical protein
MVGQQCNNSVTAVRQQCELNGDGDGDGDTDSYGDGDGDGEGGV